MKPRTIRYVSFTWLTASILLLVVLILFSDSLNQVTGNSSFSTVSLGLMAVCTFVAGITFIAVHRKRPLSMTRRLRAISFKVREQVSLAAILSTLGILLVVLLALQSPTRHPVILLF